MSAILPNRIVDLAGIGDPAVYEFIARAEAAGGPGRTASWTSSATAGRTTWWSSPAGCARSSDRAHPSPILKIKVPDNVTLGRDTLGLYATPWTRIPWHLSRKHHRTNRSLHRTHREPP